jgi:hypothetical protein
VLNAEFGTPLALSNGAMSEKIKEFRRSIESAPKLVEEGVLRRGDIVPESGIYEATHKRPNADEHAFSVVAVRGERVQPCVACGEEVFLRLVRSAPHISEDADFCHPRE